MMLKSSAVRYAVVIRILSWRTASKDLLNKIDDIVNIHEAIAIDVATGDRRSVQEIDHEIHGLK